MNESGWLLPSERSWCLRADGYLYELLPPSHKYRSDWLRHIPAGSSSAPVPYPLHLCCNSYSDLFFSPVLFIATTTTEVIDQGGRRAEEAEYSSIVVRQLPFWHDTYQCTPLFFLTLGFRFPNPPNRTKLKLKAAEDWWWHGVDGDGDGGWVSSGSSSLALLGIRLRSLTVGVLS